MSLFAELKRRNVIRVAVAYLVLSWLVLQIASVLVDALELPNLWTKTVLAVLVIGFIPVLVFSWVYELTPEGLKKESGVQREDSIATNTAKKLDVAVIVLLVGAIGLFAIDRFLLDRGREAANHAQPASSSVGKSIAVLPFENLSNLDGDVGFTNGIHGDLLTQLSGVRDIKTIQRASIMAYQDTDKNYETIGEELGVANILEGGVQRAGNKVRIKVTLFDASTNDVLFLETYTRELTAENVFEIQAEISVAIAKALRAELSPEEQEQIEKLPTQNLAALEAYHRGVENYDEQTASGVAEAVEQFSDAITLDPDFANAHAMLGRVLIMQVSRGGLSLELQIEKAEPHIRTALELDDTSSEAYSALAYLRRRKQGNYDEAELAYKKALELNPNNSVALKNYATFLTNYRPDLQEAARILRKAYEIDPKNEQALDRSAKSLQLSGQLDEAQELMESTAAKNPEDATAQRKLGGLYNYYLGRFDDAIVAYRWSYFLDPTGTGAPDNIAETYLYLGDKEQAVFWGKRMLRLTQDPIWRIRYRAWILKLNGDDAAREQIALEGIRQYPRSEQVLGHLTDFDIASGHPEKSRSRFELAYPSLFERSAELNARNVFRAKDLARVLMATGELEQANYLITEALATARSMAPDLETLHLEASLHAIAGDEQKTLAAIRRYFDAGGSPYRLMFEDELKPFQDNPEYLEMAAEPEARMAAQLKRIREMEANGELAPIPELPED